MFVNLGPHPPRLWPDDLDRLHDLWLRLSGENDVGAKLHHRDVVGLALERLQHDLEYGQGGRDPGRRWKGHAEAPLRGRRP